MVLPGIVLSADRCCADSLQMQNLPVRQHRILFCGNGATKCRTVLQGDNALFSDIRCSARHLTYPAYRRWQERQFEDVAYFEPFYLKAYIAGKPHVKGLEM